MKTTLRVAVAAVALIAAAGTAAAQAPMQMPVQGVLADAAGKPITAELGVIFTLYKDADTTQELWVESQDVVFDNGFFTVYLGADTPLDLSIFRDNPAVFLGVAFDGDEEMEPIPLATAPYAAYAQYAGDAQTVGGFVPEDFAAADHTHLVSWEDLQNIPEDLLDGDSDTVWDVPAPGGLVLTGNALTLRTCAPGQILKQRDSGWECAADASDQPGDPTDELNMAAAFIDGILSITDAGGTLTVDLSTLSDGVEDDDADPTNEYNLSAALDGTSLELTDSGGTLTVDLATLRDGVEDDDADPTNELLTSVTLDGTTLTITDGARSLSVELASLRDGVEDDDADPTNEYNSGLNFVGTTLEIIDGGGTFTADLASLRDGVEDDDADPTNEYNRSVELDDTTLRITDSGGTLSADLASLQDGVEDADADPANERNMSVELTGTDLRVTDSGGTLTASLASLVDDADADPANERNTAVELSGTNLRVTDSGGTLTANLASLVNDADADPANERNTAVELSGTNLRITDSGGTLTANLASLVNDLDADPANERNTSMSLSGTNLRITDSGGTLTANLASLVNDLDADPTNERNTSVSLVGTALQVIDSGGIKSADLSSLINDADSSPINELQTLSFDRDTLDLTVSSGNTVGLGGSGYMLTASMAHSPDDIAGFTALTGDDTSVGVTMPFSITIDGTSYNQFHLSTNGWLEFGAGAGSDRFNSCLPDSGHTRPFVAFYWDDMVTNGNAIRYGAVGDAGNRVYIVDFEFRTFLTNDDVRGQLQIHEGSGLINVKYRSMAPGATGQSATIGFQVNTTKAYPITCNGKVLDDNQSGESWSVAPFR